MALGFELCMCSVGKSGDISVMRYNHVFWTVNSAQGFA